MIITGEGKDTAGVCWKEARDAAAHCTVNRTPTPNRESSAVKYQCCGG